MIRKTPIIDVEGNRSDELIVHRTLAGSNDEQGNYIPPLCSVCGKPNNKLLMVFEYKDGLWHTSNFCSEKCFSKLNIPFTKIKRKGYMRIRNVNNLLKDIPVKYYKIPDYVQFNTDIFLCS